MMPDFNGQVTDTITKKRAQVIEEASKFESRVCEMHALLDRLEKQLEPVLRAPCDEPQVESAADKTAEDLAPLAQELRRCNTHLNVSCDRIGRLMHRLEI